MKKTITLMLIILLLTGCADFKKNNDISNESSSRVNAASIELPSAPFASSPTQCIDDMSESFFFPKTINSIKYNGYVSSNGDYVSVSVMLHINREEKLENLYELILDKIEGLPDSRLNLGYFYVDNKTIYRLNNPLDEDSNIDQEYILLNSDIVCCENLIEDEFGNEDKGFHHSMEIFDEKCVSHFYNTQVETGFYETFIWELGKGLVEYKSGFGAERDSIHIKVD